ncbi:MAG TPA: DinB family protein [Pyrinomonadaceae bacterium]|nr:DinB family protein [Pyrinomonadaceae bacterium]
MERADLLVAEWTRAKLGVQEYIDAMPEDGVVFKPTPDIRSFAEHYLHVASTNYIFASVASGRDNPYDKTKGTDPEQAEDLKQKKAALLEFVMGSYDFMIDAVKGLSDAALDEDVEFFKMRMRRHMLLAKALEHHAHHRGQTAIYLRLKGVTPPSERLF